MCVNLYPFESTVSRRDVGEAEIVENIDIGGPTMIRAAAKNHAYAAVVTSPESYDAILDELRELRRPLVDADARVAGRRGVRLHGALRHRDRALVRREVRGLPAAARRGLREGHRPALRREPAPARRVLLAGRLAHARAVAGSAAPRQAAVVQQPARPRRRAQDHRRLLRRSRLRHRQAQQPVRRRARRRAAAGLRARLRDRPAERVRRRHRLQPADRPRDGRALSEQFVEVLFAPGYEDDALEVLTRKPSIRILRGQRAAHGDDRRARHQAGHGRAARAGPRHRVRRPHGDGDRDGARADAPSEWRDLLFAWQICKHVRSNAIVLAKDSARRPASAPGR